MPIYSTNYSVANLSLLKELRISSPPSNNVMTSVFRG
jgi:hypothetical protein